jgi:poly-beta-1,6-N-acetyl-D-glucosamine biosynthesis protein PgaD
MRSGKAPTAEASSVGALVARHWSHRRPVPTGVLALLTVLFWGMWVYLVLPVVSLVLWVLGVRLFIHEMAQGGYEALLASLAAYSSVLLVLIGLLALWIGWNVARYGGSSDRRTVKRAEVPDSAVRDTFRLDDGVLSVLRSVRLVHVDLNGDGSVEVLLVDARPRTPHPAAEAGANGRGGPQRGRESTRSG